MYKMYMIHAINLLENTVALKHEKLCVRLKCYLLGNKRSNH